jgi:Domain of unknown function (DUF4365)
MERSLQQEQFSLAYARAVATIAGYAIYRPEIDDDSIDLGVAARGGGGTLRSPRLEIQVKCTGAGVLHESDVRYPLKLKNYDDLRLPCHVPRILLVVLVPDDPANWLTQTEDELILRRCGYWASLAGRPESANETSVTVHLPRANVFSPAALKDMMTKIGEQRAL